MAYNKATVMGPFLVGTIIYIIIGFIGSGSGNVQATHFRGGTISWKPSDSFSLSYREIIFTFKLGWRLSRIGCDDRTISSGTMVGEDARWFCMYGCKGVVASTREKCTEFNLGDDWMFGSNTFKNVFDSDGPIEISYMECCWLTDLVVGAGGEWALTTTLNLGIRSDTGGPNSSPVTAMAPMITLRAGVPDVIDLAVRDSDGDKVMCRLGRHVGECGTICSLFAEFTLDEENCLIRYTPASNTTGKIPVAIMVEDHHRSNEGITMGKRTFSMTDALSSVPVQFLVILNKPTANCSEKPLIDTSIPASIPVKVRPGRNFTFTVTSTPCDSTSRIEEFVLIAPIGVRKSPTIVSDGDYITQITWTPDADQDGSNLICVSARSSDGVLSDQICITVDVPKATAFCSVVGGSHFITFDKSRYNFYGMCTYQLVGTIPSAASKMAPFSVLLSNEGTPVGNNAVRIGQLDAEVMNQKVTIDSKRDVFLNGVLVNLPIRLKSGLRVEKSGRGVSIALSMAIRIYIDGGTLSVQLSQSYAGHVEGLCGNYNGEFGDDLALRGGIVLASDEAEFAASFQIDDENERCHNGFQLLHDKPNCSEDGLIKATEKCSIITKVDGGCFTQCHDVFEPKNFYDNCINVLCEVSDDFTALDVLIRAYADTCQREGVSVCDWRAELGITMECEPYSHYEKCANTIPATCADSISTISPTPSESCIEGCACNKGYILSGSSCVPESECGCIINDIYYPKGFTYRTEECEQECVCGEGCKDADPCNTRAKCQRGTDGFHRCIEKQRNRATCKAVTDPHYQTFDGTKFDSMGTCAYIMVRSKRNATKSTAFTVISVNEISPESKNASHVKEVHVDFGDGHILTFVRGPRIFLDDKEINPGSSIYGVDIRKVGKFVVADFNFGLVIRWDGIDRVRITAWSPLRYMVEGLCGDWDDNADNDFAVRPTDENLPDPGSFAESWRVEGYGTEGCRDHPGIEIPQPPCLNEESLARYQEECQSLKDPDGAFANCHALVDPIKAFDNCVYDLCAYDGDKNIKDRTFSSYADDCLEESGVPKSWRPAENLTEICVNGTFSDCMEQCQPTCSDPTASMCFEKKPNQLGSTCVEGCVCADGLVLSGNGCVRPEDCGCMINGRYEKKGFSFAVGNCSQTCVCQGPEDIICGETPFGCKKNRDSCEMREDGYFECVQRLRRRATCKAVTDPHYMTFDRKNFDSMGTCSYIMVRSKDTSGLTPFRVVTVNEQPWPNRTVSHVKEAWIHVGDDLTIAMTKGGIIKINGRVVDPGTNTSGVQIRKIGRFTVADFDFGLVVKWDGQDRIRISAWGKLRGKIEGLCGDFDDDETNDFMTSYGELVTNITTFVNSWKVSGYENDDCRDPMADVPNPLCSIEEHKETCSTLRTNVVYAKCLELVDPEQFIQDCIFDLCAYDGDTSYKERIFSEYISECQEKNVTMHQDWRELDNLESFECGENAHYRACIDQCQPTCTDPDGSVCKQAGTLGTECAEGCACNEGYTLSGNKCVLQSECGCVAEDGTYLQQGFKYRTENCTLECECGSDGIIACANASQCPKGDRCRLDTDGYKRCIKHIRRRATCKAITDPHYMTFDGVNYDSMGTCAYIMARSKEGANVTSFRVVAVNERPNANQTVSHVKEVYVHVGDDITLTLKAGPVVAINGEVVLPGTTLNGIEVRQVGRFTVAEFPFGLVVRWDGIDRLRVMAWAKLKGMMEGLCGDFDDNEYNDFMTPDGVMETRVNEFVNSWKVDGYNTEDCEDPPEVQLSPCESEEKLEEFRESCRVLVDPDSPLLSCFEVKDPTSSFNDCVFDLCAYNGDPVIRERVISSYTEDCREEAVSDEVPPGDLDFREPEEEAALCGDNSHFASCISSCQPTCNDRDGSKCLANANSASAPCVDACQCDDGYVLSGNSCVREEECGCEIEGRYVQKGFTFVNGNCTNKCTCLGEGQIDCVATEGCGKGLRCRINDEGKRACVTHVRRRATCKAVTDPHYMTFDGVKYDSMGTCAYVMIRSREEATVGQKFRVIAVNEQPAPHRIVSHVKEVHIDVGRDFRVSFLPGAVVKINGEEVLPGSKVRYVQIRKVGRFTVAEFDFGLVVKWDGIDRLRIIAWAPLKGQMEGLCGDFNDDPSNDLTTPRGVHEPNINRFVRSWRTNELSPRGCVELPPGTLNDTDCSDQEVYQRYLDDCLVLTDPEGDFKNCHDDVDPQSFFDDCLFDLCNMGGNRTLYERHLHEYTESCLEYLVPSLNDTLPPQDCPEDMISAVPMEQCQPTCNDPDASICKANSSLGEHGVAGCECRPGLLLAGNRCVAPGECGCRIDGKYRDIGFKYLNRECDVLCECTGVGDVICIPTDPCSTRERCTKVNERYQCTPHTRNKATCKAITDPHYSTFDGKTFDSSASCAYIMTRSLPDSDVPDFRVVAVNERDSTLSSSSHVMAVHVYVGDDFKLVFERGLRVRINGVFYHPGSTVRGAAIRKVGLFTLIEFSFGLVIRWDGKDRLRVTVWDQLKGKVEGLCGRYNDDMDDDFTMPNGDVTNDMTEFVRSWHTKEQSLAKCVHLQDEVASDCSSPDVLAGYEDECKVLIDTGGPFAQCHRVVDPKPAYDACVADLCRMDGDRDLKDRVLTSYVHDCLEFSKGPEPWRLGENLPIGCPGNSKYSRCMHQCQSTCSDPDGTICKKKLPYLLGDNCVEGCKCNPGFYLSADKCVPVRNCGCLVDGIYYEKRFKYRTPGCRRECICRGQNVFECTDTPDGCLDTERCKVAHGGYYQCAPRARKRGTCKAITDPHYTTFDGAKFDSQGVCSYTMVRSKNNATVDPFSVVAVNEQPLQNTRVSHVKEVHVDYRGHRLSFYKGPVIELNGEVVISGTSQSGMKLKKVGRYMAAIFNFGLSIRWDGADRLRIIAMKQLGGQVEGVCGDFDEDPSNDLTLAGSDEITADPENFVNSWRAQGFGDGCPAPLADFLNEEPPFECLPDDMRKAEEACAAIVNPLGPLRSCKRLTDTKTSFADCVLDMCAYAGDKSIQDRVISDFSEDCREGGGELGSNWRKEVNLTEVQCPPNSHFETCMPQCQPSCEDLDGSDCRANDIGGNCVEGCQADNGFVISGDDYVPVTECGCLKDGRYHKSGDVFYTEGCKTQCDCQAGVVTCKMSSCGREEECVINGARKLDCVRIETSTCQAWGSTHFMTFDGRYFDVTNNCQYVLAKREIERGDPRSRLESFFLTASVMPSPGNDQLTTVKNVRIRFPTQGLTILLRQAAQIEGKTYYNWRNEDKDRLITVDRRGSFTVLKTFFGLEVAYDGANIRVTIPKRFAGKTNGLCGNFNGDADDDFTLKNGSPNQDPFTFARDYSGSVCRNSKALPPLSCSDEDKSKWGASNKCGAILHGNSEFANCSTILDARKYFEKCVEDVCRSGGSDDVLAQALKTYAHECMAIDDPVCDWRQKYLLQIACPVNSHYAGCTEACEDTCGTEKEKQCRYQQVEDCVCDEGYIRSNGQCIAKSTCGGCLINRKIVPKGFTYRTDKCSRKCTCLGNEHVACEAADGCISRAKCARDDLGFSQCLFTPRRQARCQAFGNGHLMTFDGSRFNTTATCAFIMARSREDSSIPAFSVKVNMQPSSSSNLSRVAEVIVTAENMNMVMAQGRTVMVNGRSVALGSVLETVTIRKFGRFVVAIFKFGVTLRWDGRQNLRIEVKRPLAGLMEGLCGDFDEDEKNDYRTPSGVIESDLSVFVNSWRDERSDSGCRLQKTVKSPCRNVDDLTPYKEYCKTKYNGNYTSECNLFEYCLFEMCASGGDRDYTDETAYSFFESCSGDPVDTSEPPAIDPPVIDCPINSHFNSCMAQCQPACSDADASVCKSYNDQEECASGCQCDEGYMLDRENCVRKSDCGCVDGDGEYYPNQYDSYLEECGRKCQCNNGTLTCQETPCSDEQYCGHKDGVYGCHWENECNYNNGDCDQVCSWVNEMVVCSCRDGYNLTSDNKTCKGFKPECETAKKNFTQWKSNTMQIWIRKLDSYMEAMKRGAETGEPAFVCKTIWTEWFDRNDPDQIGDDESLELLKAEHPAAICDRPVAIEAQLSDGRNAFASGLVIRTMSAADGLRCYNADQRQGENCGDFRVRFLCLEELI